MARRPLTNSDVGQFILDCMNANSHAGDVVPCPNCGAAVYVEQCGDEEHVVCQWCGLAAIDGAIVVPGRKDV